MVNKTILHYKIIKKLGEGGMGVVYLAEDTRLDRKVAIKFLPPHIAGNSDERKRFEIEAKAAAALNHPNIATIHAIDEVDNEMFIVMEYIEGVELKEKLKSGPLSVDEAQKIAFQIARGLEAAHKKNIIHRDIKSTNIMITDTGQVKIMDFGLAKVRGGIELTKQQSTIGTAAYMSPEQARGDQIDQRADIWSFAVVFYEMLMGELPFKGNYDQAIIYAIMNENPQPISNPDVPKSIVDLVDQSLQKDKAGRPQSMTEILNRFDETTEAGKMPASALLARSIRKPQIVIPLTIMLIALIAGIIWIINHNAKLNRARNEVLPKIEVLVQDIPWTGTGLQAWQAFQLAASIEQFVADDPQYERLKNSFSRDLYLISQPAGAAVSVKPYSDPQSPWQFIGETPLNAVSLPIGLSKVKLEKSGYDDVTDILWNTRAYSDTMHYIMSERGKLPKDMVLLYAQANWYKSGAFSGPHLPGLDHLEAQPTGDFLMDVFEVSNREYKKFVDQGGYERKEFWKHPFNKEGRILSWDEAMKLFVDRTGQPGPSTWEVGSYIPGKEDLPVSGVSWYEAAAYADFAGKSLPTIYHWDDVACAWASPEIIPQSNLGSRGPHAVNHSVSMNRFGVYDLAGNVREWCYNQTNLGEHFILGGGWNDPAYAFNDAYAQPAFDRSETNGFRCIKYIDTSSDQSELERTINVPFRDYRKEKPVPPMVLELYLNQYAYDKTELNAVVESIEEQADCIREKISFDAAYGKERMQAYLFRPKSGKPPYQTVIYFPGSGALHSRSSENLSLGLSRDFIVKSGRALIQPIYKSTFERGGDLATSIPNETNFYKERVIMWAKDLRRSVDYLETRDDINTDLLAFYGLSWGGRMAPIMLAVENRFKVAILYVAGLRVQSKQPEVDPFNFLPKVQIPVLMLNGKYDFFFPYETSQLPFFQLLGTATEHKKMFVYERGHSVPRTELAKESLKWLDTYLGPVD